MQRAYLTLTIVQMEEPTHACFPCHWESAALPASPSCCFNLPSEDFTQVHAQR